MSTRSLIGIKDDDKVKYIYCHNDGYLNGVGYILNTHYKEKKLVDALLALGDISALGDKPMDLGESAWDSLDSTIYRRGCRTYASRGEEDVEAREGSIEDFEAEADDKYVDYLYLFDPETSTWTYNDFTSGEYEPLDDVYINPVDDADIGDDSDESVEDAVVTEPKASVEEEPLPEGVESREAKKARLLQRLGVAKGEPLHEGAKPDGDRKGSYNKALELAKKLNKPVVYGYTTKRTPGKFYEVAAKEYDGDDDAFRAHYSANVIYVAYPDKKPVKESFESDFDFQEDTENLLNALSDMDEESGDATGEEVITESAIDAKKRRAIEKYNKYKEWSGRAKDRVCCECNISEEQLNEWIGE